jgi:ribulose-bisphosphate carboxylase large chain
MNVLGAEVRVTYQIESPMGLERAANVIAGEQSSGTFVPVPGETDDLMAEFRASVVGVVSDGWRPEPSLPGCMRAAGRSGRVEVGWATLAFPVGNFGVSLPNLLSTVAGNVFELRELGAVRLVDIELPAEFAEKYPGPAFGPGGTRELMGVKEGPLIGTIVKPSVGLTPEELAKMVKELCTAGLDFVKDDELLGNPAHCPLERRVDAVMRVIDKHAEQTGKRVMYAFNITDEPDKLQRNYELVRQRGGNCVMVCIAVVGFGTVSWLRRLSELPIHGHRAMSGVLLRSPAIGMSPRVFQALARLAGVDQLHCGGIDSKFYEDNDGVVATVQAVRQPLLSGYACLPVLSSAQWAGTAERSFQMLGTDDLLVLAGGGIHSHPGGPRGGVESMRLAWDAARRGVPFEECAKEHAVVAAAVERFGGLGLKRD